LFLNLAGHLKKQPFFQHDSEEETDQAVSRFAKKLLGQVVFLYFLQKKGWLGVPKDGKWGEGSRRYMRERFDLVVQNGGNYFCDFLQYLFYEALARERKGRNPDYYPRFDCKIPFLNGGLFEAEYDWENERIDLPNELFHNDVKNKAGDKGTGILDVFDRYNFTIKEDEPLEKEVAIDPEMLGKVFENMLEVTERKSKGAFYTPREIVHYMCQESLIYYLDSTLNIYAHNNGGDDGGLFSKKPGTKIRVPKEDLETLIRKGHMALENDQRVLKKGKETETYRFQLPGSVRKHAKEIDKALADIKICDPAIGSGAFPVGLLHEIVNARLALAPHSGNTMTAYDLKRHAIRESIYGVDIDASAIDIARLRLWLSLIVDEERYDTIEPLPNLDYKIVRGNSLIGFPENWQSPAFQKIEQLKNRFFEETDQDERARLKTEIDQEIRKRFANSRQVFGYQVDFDFRLLFSEVWHKKGGFDIVIGNPPYVRADRSKQHLALRKTILKSKQYETLWEKWDLYVPFIEKGFKLLKDGGITTMIVSDAYCHSKYAQKSQKWFLRNSRVLRLDFFSKLQLFDAGVHNITYFFQKTDGGRNKPERRVHEPEFGQVTYLSTDEQRNLDYRTFFPEDRKTALVQVNSVCLAEICYISYGLRPSSDGKEKGNKFVTADLISETQDEIHSKPYVDGKHLDRWLPATNIWIEWGTERAPGLFYRPTFEEMYVVPEKILVQRSPGPDPKACYDNKQLIFTPSSVGFIPWHFLSGVRNRSIKKSARYKDEKPSRPELPSRENLEEISRRFAIKYLLAVMNSSVARDLLRTHRRSNIHLYPDDWRQLPIPDILPSSQLPFQILVDFILFTKEKEQKLQSAFFEQVIDGLVYELYFPDEIKAAGKEILPHLGELSPITDSMSEKEKLAIIQREFNRLYDPNHPVRNAIETLDSVDVVRTIREALKK